MKILTSNLEGESREEAKKLLNRKFQKGTIYLLSGETTVKVVGDGAGGRNQEFVLAALNEMKKSGIKPTLKPYRLVFLTD